MSMTQATKTCTRCHVEKPIAAFGRLSGPRRLAWDLACKACKDRSKKERESTPTGAKHCPKCDQCLPLKDFHKNSLTKDGLVYSCKACTKKMRRVYYNRHVADGREAARRRAYWDTQKAAALKKAYRLTSDEYKAMLKSQRGKCAICGGHQKSKSCRGRVKMLAVDHDHETGRVRGLLCSTCNSGLGHFKDRRQLLKAAIIYLEKHEETLPFDG